MSRISERFAQLRRRNEKALIIYLTAGFPSMSAMPALVKSAVEAGVDLIELGVPFSDPLADGPTIQMASQKALQHGVTVPKIFALVKQLRKSGVKIPLVLMTYYNPVFHYGVSAFCRQAKAAGVDGLIVPDLPPEESAALKPAARASRLDLIFLAAPTSSAERLRKIANASSGFVYSVSLTGVTGTRKQLPADVVMQARRLKKVSRIPVCVGFGISRPDQARRVASVADGVIVGSALIQKIAKSGPRSVGPFLKGLKRACR
jgi:tryptophan synthase alpha chain